MSLWRDHAAMRAYVESGSHRVVMPKLVEWADQACFAHWHQPGAQLPAWAEAASRLKEAGRAFPLRHGDDSGAWLPAQSPTQITQAVHDNLRNLGLERLDVVNLRMMGRGLAPGEDSLEEQFSTLARLREDGLIAHLGLSNVTAAQVAQAQAIAPVVCVQNYYNVVHRADDGLIDALAAQGIAYVPFFPLGGLSPIQSEALSAIAAEVGASAMQVALAWLLARAPHMLLIPGTSSLAHLADNLAAAQVVLPAPILARLAAIA